MKRLLALLIIIGTLGLMGIQCFSQEKPDPNFAKAPEFFDRQYQAAYNAYKNGDEQGIKSILDTFKLPHDWFIKYFGADHAADLEKVYDERFDYFEQQTIRRYHWMDKSEDSTIDTRLYVGDKPLARLGKPAPASLLLPLPDAKMFSIRYTKSYGTYHMFGRTDKPEGDSFSWGDRFMEVDGEYKFFGLGGYPFWDIPPMGLADLCDREGDKTSGLLVKRVEPEFPEAALHTQKPVVVITLTIAKDGSVTNVEFLRGDAALFHAAKTAAMQWRYTPWMNCGKPVEARTVVQFMPSSKS